MLWLKKNWNIPCRAKSTLDRIHQKLKLFKQYFKGWGFNFQGELRKQRKEFQNELIELESLEETEGLIVNQVDRKLWLM